MILLATGQGGMATLFWTAMAALSGGFVALGMDAHRYQAAVKARFAQTTSRLLSGFDHDTAATVDLARLRAWRLFPDPQGAVVEDRITGRRNGHTLSLSIMSVRYRRNIRKSNQSPELHVAAVEVETGPAGRAQTVLVPTAALARLRGGDVQRAQGLNLLSSGDEDFDAAYSIASSGPEETRALLSPTFRPAVLDLARGDGAAPRAAPYVVIMPFSLAVLFPLGLKDRAFVAKPYWVPLDADAVLAQFASDLARKIALINATLALLAPSG